jgi:hypothetical protein
MRFGLKHHGQLSCIEHYPEGEYVLHSDYARINAEVERLTAFTTRTIIPNEELQAEVKRLQVEVADWQESYHLVNERMAQILKQGK